MNRDIAEGKWTQFKGEIQKTWGKITGDELEKTKGDMKSIAGLVQERYGLAKDETDRKLTEMSSKYRTSDGSTTQNLKEKASDFVESAKEKLDRSNDKHRPF